MLGAAAGVTAAAEVQRAMTPGNLSLPQRTPGMLAPLSDNALWSSKYKREFDSKVLEVRVSLALSPAIQVLLVHTHAS